MGKKLYVGSLPYSVGDDELKNMFAGIGEVASAKVITDHYSGRSKGFGFVEMATDELAKAAINALNGTASGSRTILVSEARSEDRRGGSGGNGGNRSRTGGHGGRDRDDRRGGGGGGWR